MKIAIVGSRNVIITQACLDDYAAKASEIVSGGAVGVDQAAAEYAKQTGKRLTEFLPKYSQYGRTAPIVRNKEIVDYADEVFAFWDGKSKGTLLVIRYAQKVGKPYTVILCES